MKPRATLDRWELDVCGRVELNLCGIVSDHPKLRDGIWIRTSSVLRLDLEAGTAETMNTYYTLKPRE